MVSGCTCSFMYIIEFGLSNLYLRTHNETWCKLQRAVGLRVQLPYNCVTSCKNWVTLKWTEDGCLNCQIQSKNVVWQSIYFWTVSSAPTGRYLKYFEGQIQSVPYSCCYLSDLFSQIRLIQIRNKRKHLNLNFHGTYGQVRGCLGGRTGFRRTDAKC